MSRACKNPDDDWMPPRVHRGKSAYEFHTTDDHTVRLCNPDLTRSQVWAVYENFISNLKVGMSFSALCEEFFNSGDSHGLAAKTRKGYGKYGSKVNVVFGKVKLDSIKSEHVRKHMDKRSVKSKVQINREEVFMSGVFRWAYERGKVKMNSCQGVKQFKKLARTRHISDRGYDALYNIASIPVKVAMRLVYLCCTHQGDILDLKKSQILGRGILTQQSKTAVSQIKAWTKRLEDVVNPADSIPLNSGVMSIFVIHQPSGLRYTHGAFNTQWVGTKEIAIEKYPNLDFQFTSHDLKAKGISDLKSALSKKQEISGHKNVSQTAGYNRRISVVLTVGGQ